jgi:2'-5' RNA ligase
MPYTIAIFPKFKGLNKINSIIKKYYPSPNQLKPHIALVYYFKEKPTREKIDEATKKFSSFKIRLNKIRASSKNNYIFLDVTEGKEKISKLKKLLYKKLNLKWKGDFLYKPHITLANFETKKEQKSALKEIKKERLDFFCKIDSLLLLEMASDLITLKSKRKFNLS